MDELREEPRLRVAYLDAYKVGGCQGCTLKEGKVFEINSRGWITRLCRDCLEHVWNETKRYCSDHRSEK